MAGSPQERGTPSSPSDLGIASERPGADKALPNVRPVPVMVMREYLDSSEWEDSAHSGAGPAA